MHSITFQPLHRLSPAELLEFSHLNRDFQCEMNANGSISLRTPPRARFATATNALKIALEKWLDDDSASVVESRMGFVLRNGAVRHPSLAWVRAFKMAAQTEHLIERVPDFFLEFLTASESLALVRTRMNEYIANGARLGWLVDLDNEMVYVFQENTDEKVVENFQQRLTGGDILRGFSFDLAAWK